MGSYSDTESLNLEGRRVTLVGLGRSSVAAAQLLLRHGAKPFISEKGESTVLAPWRAQCDTLGIHYELGAHSGSLFAQSDLVVVSPGVPLDAACLDAPRRKGIPIVGELEMAWRFCRAKTLAVTGTNGKTTVTTLVQAMIAACGHSVALAGNNDTPLSLVVIRERQPDYVVLEVSSYQLETANRFHPNVAAVLNITPDHLGRHGNMEGYAAAKSRMFQRQGPGDAAICNADDPLVMRLPVPDGTARYYFTLKQHMGTVVPGRGLAGAVPATAPDTWHADEECLYFGDRCIARQADNPLPGRHNLANVLAALAVVHAGGFDIERAVAGLRDFTGVEHRIEYVTALDGVVYYNDSKSTNVDSVRVAVESFDQPVVLLAGGRGKGSDYAPLRPLMQARVKQLIVLGEDAARLENAYRDCVPVERADSMMDAVRRARRAAAPGDVVLLSPGCASFDMYDNFEARGRDYKDCVYRLLSNGAGVTEARK